MSSDANVQETLSTAVRAGGWPAASRIRACPAGSLRESLPGGLVEFVSLAHTTPSPHGVSAVSPKLVPHSLDSIGHGEV
jgi:hypothetical protein